VSRDEPGCFEVVLFEELEEAADTDGACEETWSDGLEIEGREGGRGKVPRLMSLEESSPP
jgi:hypothetical protein